MFFSALAYAPWAYGGTTATSIVVINWLLGTALLLWVIELLASGSLGPTLRDVAATGRSSARRVNRRWPRFPRVLIALVVALLAVGGWMVVNALAIYDPEFGMFAPVANLAPHAPGSVDYAISAAWMIRGALLLGTILFVVDFSQSNRGLLHLWYAIGIVAGSIALLGLLQKATGAEMIFWQPVPEKDKGFYTFFASYYYHANAGAFLNLVLPLTAGLALRSFTSPSTPAQRAVWLSIFVMNLAAIAANTSRAAQLVGLMLLLPVAIQLFPFMIRNLSRAKLGLAVVGTAAILLLLFAILRASHLEKSHKRWQNVGEYISNDARWLSSRIAIGVLPNVGLLGFGPGTFRVVFPIYNNRSIQPAPGGWRFLHEDYLQTLLEWGWVGSALWALLFFGAILVAIRSLYRQRALRRRAAGKAEKLKTEMLKSESELSSSVSASQRFSVSVFSPAWSPRRRLILPLAVIALGGVALHALVDFPLQIYSIQLYAATYIGVCWGSADVEDKRNAETLKD